VDGIATFPSILISFKFLVWAISMSLVQIRTIQTIIKLIVIILPFWDLRELGYSNLGLFLVAVWIDTFVDKFESLLLSDWIGLWVFGELSDDYSLLRQLLLLIDVVFVDIISDSLQPLVESSVELHSITFRFLLRRSSLDSLTNKEFC